MQRDAQLLPPEVGAQRAEQLAVAADLRVATDSSVFGIPAAAVDLDRPQEGILRVDQGPMQRLATAIFGADALGVARARQRNIPDWPRRKGRKR